MEVFELPIASVVLLKPSRHEDSRGYFSEFHAERLDDAGLTFDFIQDIVFLSAERGTIRGLHFRDLPPYFTYPKVAAT
jgi:dTDP-4-dehydrorhamnose 3,5-epimerase-like enzyme